MLRIFSFKQLPKAILSQTLVREVRSISTTSTRLQPVESHFVEPKEVRIDAPWGHIAGKWYGSENLRPILLLHGWQDNSGTFDTLIPLLPKQNAYLSIDLPGHGLSSRLPSGMFYGVMNFVCAVNIIRRHYKWDHVSFCSHSMGAQISTLFASLYPERCDLLICLDALMRPSSGSIDRKIRRMQQIGDELLTIDALNRNGKEPPIYTYEEIVERWAKQSKMPPGAIEHLMKRGVCQSTVDPNRFYFSRDIRLKIMDFASTMDIEIYHALLERITAPHLFIKANNAPIFEGKERYEKVLNILTTSNPKFQWLSVLGGHHCHLSDPTLVSNHISSFINKYRQQIV